MRKILLDTSAYIAFFSGDKKVFSAISSAEDIYVPAVVAGELHSGFDVTAKGTARRREFAEFIRKPTVSIVPVIEETAEFYGKIIAALRKNGTPIPINDVWIAANAFEIGAVTVSYDKHFLKIPGLMLWDDIYSIKLKI